MGHQFEVVLHLYESKSYRYPEKYVYKWIQKYKYISDMRLFALVQRLIRCKELKIQFGQNSTRIDVLYNISFYAKIRPNIHNHITAYYLQIIVVILEYLLLQHRLDYINIELDCPII